MRGTGGINCLAKGIKKIIKNSNMIKIKLKKKPFESDASCLTSNLI